MGKPVPGEGRAELEALVLGKLTRTKLLSSPPPPPASPRILAVPCTLLRRVRVIWLQIPPFKEAVRPNPGSQQNERGVRGGGKPLTN